MTEMAVAAVEGEDPREKQRQRTASMCHPYPDGLTAQRDGHDEDIAMHWWSGDHHHGYDDRLERTPASHPTRTIENLHCADRNSHDKYQIYYTLLGLH